MVEHDLDKVGVGGSFPSGGTNKRSLTQWIRVLVFETRSWEFESLRAGQIFKRRVQMDSDKSDKISGTLAQLVEQ